MQNHKAGQPRSLPLEHEQDPPGIILENSMIMLGNREILLRRWTVGLQRCRGTPVAS
jgi:hypothetical protein